MKIPVGTIQWENHEEWTEADTARLKKLVEFSPDMTSITGIVARDFEVSPLPVSNPKYSYRGHFGGVVIFAIRKDQTVVVWPKLRDVVGRSSS